MGSGSGIDADLVDEVVKEVNKQLDRFLWGKNHSNISAHLSFFRTYNISFSEGL